MLRITMSKQVISVNLSSVIQNHVEISVELDYIQYVHAIKCLFSR